MLLFIFCVMEIIRELLNIDQVWYSKRLLTYLQVLFESSFLVTKHVSMLMVRCFEVMLGETLDNSVQNSVVFLHSNILIN
jgi:hypothetical protein